MYYAVLKNAHWLSWMVRPFSFSVGWFRARKMRSLYNSRKANPFIFKDIVKDARHRFLSLVYCKSNPNIYVVWGGASMALSMDTVVSRWIFGLLLSSVACSKAFLETDRLPHCLLWFVMDSWSDSSIHVVSGGATMVLNVDALPFLANRDHQTPFCPFQQ